MDQKLIEIYRDLSRELGRFKAQDFGPRVAWVYNPLDYAGKVHEAYLRKYCPRDPGSILFLGMNPGPDGMAQTGIPFGALSMVRDYLALEGEILPPAQSHPKKPVLGFACQKEEPSGMRLWGLIRSRYPEPRDFFRDQIILNYCPLLFLTESGRNLAASDLPAQSARTLVEICDRALGRILEQLRPRVLVGIGAYAETALKRVSADPAIGVRRILHPSPASPAANRGWAEQATRQLEDSLVWPRTNPT